MSPGLISLGISSLVLLSGLRPPDRSFGGASSGLFIVPEFYLILRVSEVLERTASRLQTTYLEVCLLPSVVLVSRRRRFFQASSLLSDGILSVAVFSRVLQGGEEKIAVIE